MRPFIIALFIVTTSLKRYNLERIYSNTTKKVNVMNIMILSAGTRVQLVRYFMDSANGFDKVVTTD
jgi:hypothetical protein